MAKVIVKHNYILTDKNGNRFEYKKGEQEIPDDHAAHPWSQHAITIVPEPIQDVIKEPVIEVPTKKKVKGV